MSVSEIAIKEIAGLKVSKHRGLAFLTGDHKRLDAAQVFSDLTGKERNDVRARFDSWLNGVVHDNWYHGWPNDENYKHCFSFRWTNKRGKQRLYGFLWNPKESQPSFQVCILHTHDIKKEWNTDKTILDFANYLRSHPDVLAAVAAFFGDKKPRPPWITEH
jgi:hypothetical protein